MQQHTLFMKRCLELAELGKAHVSSNPMVGALLVYKGVIVAENYHQHYGGPHAEVLAIDSLISQHGSAAAAILKNSTLYVSLEPCSHHGKTPPCVDKIIGHEIPEVVIAMQDPAPHVNGKGIQRLRDHGINVITGILEDEAKHLNRRFMSRIQKQRPYIILKWAQTADGYMAPEDGKQKWITGNVARTLTHRWRSEEDAILVGLGTAIADNPKLTVRQWKGKNPTRILIDPQLKLSEDAALLNDESQTIIFNALKTEKKGNRNLISLELFDLYLPHKIAYQLYLMDVQSLIVEGGINTLNEFIEAGLWDEARVFTGGQCWSRGRKAPTLLSSPQSEQKIGRDTLRIYKNGM